MIEIISEMFSKFGILGVVITLVFYFIKKNPITSISSSAIEIKLATKEKRFYVRVIKDILLIALYVVILIFTTIAFYTDEKLYSNLTEITIILITLGLFLWTITLDAKGITFSDLVSKWRLWWKWLLLMIFLMHFMSLFVITGYYMGTQLFTVFSGNTFTDAEIIPLYVVLLMLYIFIAMTVHFLLVDTYLRFLGFKDNNKYMLTIKIEDEKWYLFHPIDKEVYLLGNKSVLNECSKFSFIERSELLKNIVEIES